MEESDLTNSATIMETPLQKPLKENPKKGKLKIPSIKSIEDNKNDKDEDFEDNEFLLKKTDFLAQCNNLKLAPNNVFSDPKLVFC